MKRMTYRMFQRVFIMASLSAIYVRVRSKIFFGGFPVFLFINPRQQKLDETRTTTTYF